VAKKLKLQERRAVIPPRRALREAAFHERCKIHDIIMQGIDAALKKRGYPSIDDLKTGKKR
jgi:hypothetical protein